MVQEEECNWGLEAEIQEEDVWDDGDMTIEEDAGSLEWEELDDEEVGVESDVMRDSFEIPFYSMWKSG